MRGDRCLPRKHEPLLGDQRVDERKSEPWSPGDLLSPGERERLRAHIAEIGQRIGRLQGQINALEVQRLSVRRELEEDRRTRKHRGKAQKVRRAA